MGERWARSSRRCTSPTRICGSRWKRVVWQSPTTTRHRLEYECKFSCQRVGEAKAHHDTGKLVVVGHSAGAAYAGAMLGKFPGLINSAVLVSTTCDADLFYRVNSWRGAPANESTLEYANKVPKNAQVVFIAGVNDRLTPISLAKSCHEAFLTNGVGSSLYEVVDAAHNFDSRMYESPEFISAMKSALTIRTNGYAGD